jgi:outer membrane protein
VKQASDEKFNLELGLNVRVVDFEAEVRQPSTGLSDSESITLPLPMLYVGAQLDPVEWLALEAEFRGITFDNDHMYDLIGRVKFRPKGPLFIAAGWRLQDVDIEEDDVRADVSFSGPFVEVGAEF